MVKSQKGWVLIGAYHPTAFEEGVYVVDFWKKGTVKVDRNLKRYQVKAKSKSQAIRKAKKELQKDIK